MPSPKPSKNLPAPAAKKAAKSAPKKSAAPAADAKKFVPSADARRRELRNETFGTGGEFDQLFAQWRASGDPALRDHLILMHRNLVVALARRFVEKGEIFEDLVQQGLIGLIYALDHFDSERGVRFTTFATPAVLGEIRRYFRDKSWCVRVPRRLQELHHLIGRTVEQLTQTYNRAPTYGEIANALNLHVDEVVEVLEMAHSVDLMSLDDQNTTDNQAN